MRYREDGGLLVPDTLVLDEPVGEDTAEQAQDIAQQAETVVEALTVEDVEDLDYGQREAARLRAELAAQRAIEAVRREDTRARVADHMAHDAAMADLAERQAIAAQQRRERAREAAAQEALVALYRRAINAGARARIRADISRSAEMRAIRIARMQRATLAIGLPVLAGWAAWSTTGVQAGMVRLLGLEAGSPGWWAAWLVEPLLITIVAGLIVLRAVLRMSGGDVDERAARAEWTALTVSVVLNMVGGWTTRVDSWAAVPTAVAEAIGHSLGAIGAAGTAWLLGVVIDYTTTARPWDGAPRLADLDLTAAPQMAGEKGRPDDVPDAVRNDVRTPINLEKQPIRTSPARTRSDARTSLVDVVRAAIADGTLSPDPTGYAIYKHVMGGRGDKARAYQAASSVAGWRPEQPRINGHRHNGVDVLR